jgi:hypothetical protein
VQIGERTPGTRRTWLQSIPASVRSATMRAPTPSSPTRENSELRPPSLAIAAAALARDVRA